MSQLKNTVLSYEEGKAKYDAVQKLLLGNRQVLSRILKGFVPEYAACSLSEIETQYIEPESIRISDTFVERDLDPGRETEELITGINTEDKSLYEGNITYDILFQAVCPSKKGFLRLEINVEAQKSSHPGYPLETRGVYYAARRLGAQLRNIRKGTDYRKLRKVYSIWVCMGDVPEKEAGTASLYRMCKRDMIGTVEREERSYDLLNVIMLRVNDERETENGTLRLLQTLCSDRMGKEEKLKELREQGLRIDEELEGGMELMCNLSDLVEERGIRKGLEQGLEQGIVQGLEQGLTEGKAQMSLQMLRDGMPYVQVAKYAGVDVETLRRWEAESLAG